MLMYSRVGCTATASFGRIETTSFSTYSVKSLQSQRTSCKTLRNETGGLEDELSLALCLVDELVFVFAFCGLDAVNPAVNGKTLVPA